MIKILRNNPFQRIGDKYGHFIDTDHFLGRDPFQELWMAPSDIIKGKSGYELEIALPGFVKDEVRINVEGDRLMIKAEKKSQNKRQYLHNEIPAGARERMIKLDDSVDVDKISAKMENGILKISLPSREQENSKIEKVEIH